MNQSNSARTRRYIQMLEARYGTLAQQVEEDVSQYRDLTPQQNDEVVCSVVRSAMEILRSRPDFFEAMAEADAPAPDFAQVWRRLQERRHG